MGDFSRFGCVAALALLLSTAPGYACDPVNTAAAAPQPYNGGTQILPKPGFEAQLGANGTWPFMNTFIHTENLLHVMNADPAAPKFQVYAQSKLSEADVVRLGAVMTAMHRVVGINTVDKPTTGMPPGSTPHIMDADGLQNFFRVQRDSTIKSVLLYAEAVGWKKPALEEEVVKQLPEKVQQEAYLAELFFADPAYATHRERLRTVLEGARDAVKTEEGKKLSTRYRDAFKATRTLAHEPNRAFQRELRELVRAHLKKSKPDLTDTQFDLVWDAIREHRLD